VQEAIKRRINVTQALFKLSVHKAIVTNNNL
jgi:hypothetical protein